MLSPSPNPDVLSLSLGCFLSRRLPYHIMFIEKTLGPQHGRAVRGPERGQPLREHRSQPLGGAHVRGGRPRGAYLNWLSSYCSPPHVRRRGSLACISGGTNFSWKAVSRPVRGRRAMKTGSFLTLVFALRRSDCRCAPTGLRRAPWFHRCCCFLRSTTAVD